MPPYTGFATFLTVHPTLHALIIYGIILLLYGIKGVIQACRKHAPWYLTAIICLVYGFLVFFSIEHQHIGLAILHSLLYSLTIYCAFVGFTHLVLDIHQYLRRQKMRDVDHRSDRQPDQEFRRLTHLSKSGYDRFIAPH